MAEEISEQIAMGPISYLITLGFALFVTITPLLQLFTISLMSRQVGFLFAFKCLLISMPHYLFYWLVLVGYWQMVRHWIFLERKYWRSFGIVILLSAVSGSVSLLYSRWLRDEPTRELLLTGNGYLSLITSFYLAMEVIWAWTAYFQVRMAEKRAAKRATAQP